MTTSPFPGSLDAVMARAFCDQTKAAINQEYKRVVHNLNQISQEDMCRWAGPGINSIANLLFHMCGNLRHSFIGGIAGMDMGECPSETADCSSMPKEEIIDRMGAMVEQIGAILDGLDAQSLFETKRMQGRDKHVFQELYSAVNHFSGHSFQVSLLANLFAGGNFIPLVHRGAEE